MPKRAKKSNSNCEQHLFFLKPKNNFCRFSQTVTVSFCDNVKDKTKSKIKKCTSSSCLQCPIYNKDKNFATPTFILTSQKTYYQERGVKMREQHQKKMIEYTDQKDSLNVPKPRTKNNFCSVCRQVYEDYLDHIQSQRHKKKINSSHFNKYILDIAQKFNPQSKSLYNSNICCDRTMSTRLDSDVEIAQQGLKTRKKIKVDQWPNVFNHNNQRQPYIPECVRSHSIAPPPHLNLSHTGYFPRLYHNNSNIPINLAPNHQSNQMNPSFTFPPVLNPPMTFNYNMNIFMNPYNPYNYQFMPNPFEMFNPLMPYYQHPPPRTNHSHIPYQKAEDNYFMHENFPHGQDKTSNNINRIHYFTDNSILTNLKVQQKQRRDALYQKQSVIIIDDDQAKNNNIHKNEVREKVQKRKL